MTEQQPMTHWYMLTLVGNDRPGIVARISQCLYQAGCNLGEASMIRLGGNFTIMLMINSDRDAGQLAQLLHPVAEALELQYHLDPIEGHLHDHRSPDVRISVFGADRAGIVAQVTQALAAAGLDILELDSSVAGSEQQPIYIMQLEGLATQGIEALRQALAGDAFADVDVRIEPIDTLVG